MKRYLFIGSIDYSAHCLKVLFDMGIDITAVMCPRREASAFNSDYSDLGGVARRFGRDVRYFTDIKEEAGYVKEMRPDVIFVLGMSQILPSEVLKAPSIGCIGSHPAPLPRNRGRHPIIWAIANGLTESAVTLFWMDGGIDSGDIWAQKRFDIDILDDASSVYDKVKEITAELLRANVPLLEKGVIGRKSQDSGGSHYWRKRDYKDGAIDWRMSSKRIYDLVRALSEPYVGAHCVYRGNDIKIWRVEMAGDPEEYADIEPGKVVSRDGRRLTVKTGDGLVRILRHGFETLPSKGEYL